MKEKDDEGYTALHQAAYKWHVDVCKILIDNDADVEEKGSEGRTALHYAAISGHVDVCRFLLENGANIEEKEDNGATPLILAANFGHAVGGFSFSAVRPPSGVTVSGF